MNVDVKTIVIVVILVLIAGYGVASSFNDEEYIVTVTDKERIYDNEESKYLVFCEDEDGNNIVFENTDNILRGKWNSSDIQGQLREGRTYEVVVIGYRIPFFSMYQNVLKITEIEYEESKEK